MIIDLRSDTVTRPSEAMRAAMANAEVGDDVLDGDPTTRRLEDLVADLLGKGAALFFPTGTQANQAGIILNTRHGTELLIEAGAHLLHYEIAGLAANAGVQARPVATPDGLLTPELLGAALRPDSPHLPRVSAVTVENTNAAAGGRVMPLERMQAIGAFAKEQKLPLHLDGARLWNSSVAQDLSPSALAMPADTVMVAFSKALGCPVGSCLAFPRELRRDVWEIRKRLGGGMRQSGMLAAAAIYALENNYERIAQDHVNAQSLAVALEGHRAVRPTIPDSNIVMLDLLRERDTADDVIRKLHGNGVAVVPFGPKRLRAVTHMDVSSADVLRAAQIIGEVLS